MVSGQDLFVPKTRLKKALRKLSKSCSDAGHILIEASGPDVILTGGHGDLVASIRIPIDLDDDESVPSHAAIAVSCKDASWVSSRLGSGRLCRMSLRAGEAAFETLSGDLLIHPLRPEQMLVAYSKDVLGLSLSPSVPDDVEALSVMAAMRPLAIAEELNYFVDASDPDRDEREAHLAGVYVSGSVTLARLGGSAAGA